MDDDAGDAAVAQPLGIRPPDPGNYDRAVGPTDEYLENLRAYYKLGDIDSPYESDEPNFRLPMGDPPKFSYPYNIDRFNALKAQFEVKGWGQWSRDIVTTVVKTSANELIDLATTRAGQIVTNSLLGGTSQTSGNDYATALRSQAMAEKVGQLFTSVISLIRQEYNKKPSATDQVKKAIEVQRKELKEHDSTLPADAKNEIEERDKKIGNLLEAAYPSANQAKDIEDLWMERIFFTSFPKERKPLMNLDQETERLLGEELDKLLEDFDPEQRQDLKTLIGNIRSKSVIFDFRVGYAPAASGIGDPGTGKSRFFEKLGKILGIPVIALNLAGVRDDAKLDALLGREAGGGGGFGFGGPAPATFEERIGTFKYQLITKGLYLNAIVYAEEAVNALNNPVIGDRLKIVLDPAIKEMTIGGVKFDTSSQTKVALGQKDILDQGMRERLPAKYFRAMRELARAQVGKKSFQEGADAQESVFGSVVMDKARQTIWKYLPILIKENIERVNGVRVLNTNISDAIIFVAGEYKDGNEVTYNQIRNTIESAYRRGMDDRGREDAGNQDLLAQLENFVTEKFIPEITKLAEDVLATGNTLTGEELVELAKRLIDRERGAEFPPRLESPQQQDEDMEHLPVAGSSKAAGKRKAIEEPEPEPEPEDETIDDYKTNHAGNSTFKKPVSGITGKLKIIDGHLLIEPPGSRGGKKTIYCGKPEDFTVKDSTLTAENLKTLKRSLKEANGDLHVNFTSKVFQTRVEGTPKWSNPFQQGESSRKKQKL